MTDTQAEEIFKKANSIRISHQSPLNPITGQIVVSFNNPNEFKAVNLGLYLQENFKETDNYIFIRELTSTSIFLSFSADNGTILNIDKLVINAGALQDFIRYHDKTKKVNFSIHFLEHPKSILEIAELDPDNISTRSLNVKIEIIPLEKKEYVNVYELIKNMK